MAKDKYFFGMIQGPFNATNGLENNNLVEIIKSNILTENQIELTNFTITKLGICIDRKFDLWLEPIVQPEQSSNWPSDIDKIKLEQEESYQIIIKESNSIGENETNDTESHLFKIGKTGILELEDINIQQDGEIFFQHNMDDATYVNYVVRNDNI